MMLCAVAAKDATADSACLCTQQLQLHCRETEGNDSPRRCLATTRRHAQLHDGKFVLRLRSGTVQSQSSIQFA